MLAVTTGGCAALPNAAAPRVMAARAQAPAPTPEAIGQRRLALTPSQARERGLHEYDGRIADFSATGIEQHIRA